MQKFTLILQSRLSDGVGKFSLNENGKNSASIFRDVTSRNDLGELAGRIIQSQVIRETFLSKQCQMVERSE